MACLFIILTYLLHSKNIFLFWWSPTYQFFPLQIVLLVSSLWMISLTQGHKDFILFPSRSFRALDFIYSSLTHFELIFMYSIKYGPFLYVDTELLQHHVLKGYSFSMELPCICQKSADHIFEGLFLDCLFHSSDLYMVLPTSQLYSKTWSQVVSIFQLCASF